MSPVHRSRAPYKLVFTPAGEKELAKLDSRAAKKMRRALERLASHGWARDIERIGENRYRLKLPPHRALFRVFDDRKLILVEHVGKRSKGTYR